MQNLEAPRSPVFKAATLAILTAVTAVFTILIRIPIPATKGYFNFSDVAVFFAAFSFGPITAAVAGGLGTALADIISGYAQWAPISLFAHGVEGLLAALIVRAARRSEGQSSLVAVGWWIAGGIAGSIWMIGAYLGGGYLLAGAGALAEVGFNVVQCGVGITVGVVLTLSIRRAYPPVRAYSW